ncbi:MAG TPA: hypothetical protein VK978_02605 [Candidatus Saccharimonadales bacterium]|nr:hypothetical protein [Candidatus Saccharimonadales bacterium]
MADAEYQNALKIHEQVIQNEQTPAMQDEGSEDPYLRAANGDVILGGLYKSVGDNEVTLVEVRKGGLTVAEYHKVIGEYNLARWGLDRALQKRHEELQQKQPQAPQEET